MSLEPFTLGGMSRARAQFLCEECGWTTTKWVGRCGECQAWGSVVETAQTGAGTAATAVATPAVPIGQVPADAATFLPTGVGEFDRVLGGGMVPGAVVLLAGEPGVGKSTLLLDVAAKTSRSGVKVLYISGEESAAQVRLRAERIGALDENLYLAAESDLGRVLGQLDAIKPGLFILDSVQTIASASRDGSAGGVSQVREVASAVIAEAKARNLPTILVGHVTKDGTIAGPRVLEHLVDVVCQFEGDKHAQLRIVRAVKNRYGATDELGCFVMDDTGIHSLADPSGLFLSSSRSDVTGSAVTVTLDGRRPLPTEIQALVAASSTNSPRRTTQGVDSSRVAMVQAVLLAQAGVMVGRDSDVYVSCVGGAKAQEPAADLAIALALTSSLINQPTPEKLVVIGEVSLTGELRPVLGTTQRLAEAHRLGFTRAIVPARTDGAKAPTGMTVKGALTLLDALDIAFPRKARERKVVPIKPFVITNHELEPAQPEGAGPTA